MVLDTIWFSTDRNSMSAMGAMKVISTNSSSGAIRASARIFCIRSARDRLFFSGVPSAASMGPRDAGCVASVIRSPCVIGGLRERG